MEFPVEKAVRQKEALPVVIRSSYLDGNVECFGMEKYSFLRFLCGLCLSFMGEYI